MDNTLQIVNGNVTLNGTAVRCVRGFQLQTLESAPALAEVSITFDVPVKSLTTISNSESVDQSPIHQPEAPIHQPETPTERKKLLEFAVEGAKNKESKLITLLIQTKDKERVIDEMHDLIDYRKQLEQKLDKLNQNG